MKPAIQSSCTELQHRLCLAKFQIALESASLAVVALFMLISESCMLSVSDNHRFKKTDSFFFCLWFHFVDSKKIKEHSLLLNFIAAIF